MKQLITLLFVAFTLLSFSQETTYLDYSFKEVKRKKAFYQELITKEGDNVKSTISFINSGVIHKKLIYNPKLKTLKETIFWSKGGKRTISHFANGKLNGVKTIYYWGGNKKSETSYVNDLKHGDYKGYNYEGVLNTAGKYKNGDKQGVFIRYYSDSSTKHSQYMNGKMNGFSVTKDKFGNSIDSTNYIKGNKEGLGYSYYSNGTLKSKKMYVNDSVVSENHFTLEGRDTVYKEAMVSKFKVVEEMPSFEGGYVKMLEYLAKTIKYPEQARALGVKGKVYVKFVVEKDGSISSIDVVRGIGAGCDEEALQAIEDMPTWNAGSQKGKAVSVQMVLPVNFTLR